MSNRTEKVPSSEQGIDRLRKRLTNQRRELKRLNAQLNYFRLGCTHQIYVNSKMEYRNKMVAAFGVREVNLVEAGKKP